MASRTDADIAVVAREYDRIAKWVFKASFVGLNPFLFTGTLTRANNGLFRGWIDHARMTEALNSKNPNAWFDIKEEASTKLNEMEMAHIGHAYALAQWGMVFGLLAVLGAFCLTIPAAFFFAGFISWIGFAWTAALVGYFVFRHRTEAMARREIAASSERIVETGKRMAGNILLDIQDGEPTPRGAANADA